MFSQKKKKSKSYLFIIPVLCIFAFGIWMNNIYEKDYADTESEDQLTNADYYENDNKIPIYEYDKNDGDNVTDDEGKADNNMNDEELSESDESDMPVDIDDDSNVVENDGSGFSEGVPEDYDSNNGSIYVKSEDDGVIVYIHDANGNLKSTLKTDIDASLLPEYDRKNLENGIYLDTEDEIYELLQDFEG